MSLREFEQVMQGVALRNGKDADTETPSEEDFLNDLAAVAREEATRH